MRGRRRSSITLALLMTIPWSLPISFPSVIPQVLKGEPSHGVIFVADSSNSSTTITVNPKFYALNPCEKRQFTATVVGTNGQEIKNAKISWKSSNPEVAKVDQQGVAVAIKPGATMIQPIFGNIKAEPASLFVRDKGVPKDC
ncbi:MAG TPA: Ig-like domain-containing protein [Thermodesulfobacteriota bacterium]|nr:Ig-like domain-containing protein [Thermodesulfobacteriota bacterium]